MASCRSTVSVRPPPVATSLVPCFRPTTAQACNGGRGGALSTLRATYADPVAVDDSARRYGEVFDGVAEEYDRVRPGYPDELIDAACAVGGLGSGSRVVEVGCGTGKLTEALASRGLAVDAVDPGPSMIEVARRRVGRRASVRFHVARFEDLSLPDGAFDAVFSATAFHWVDPRVSWRKTAELLRPGGILALINYFTIRDERTGQAYEALDAVFKKHVPELAEEAGPPHDLASLVAGAKERSGNVSEAWTWLGNARHELAVPEAALLFEDVRVAAAPVFFEWTAETLHAFFRTTSLYFRLDPDRRDALVEDDRLAIESLGGTVALSEAAVLVTARRRPTGRDQTTDRAPPSRSAT